MGLALVTRAVGLPRGNAGTGRQARRQFSPACATPGARQRLRMAV